MKVQFNQLCNVCLVLILANSVAAYRPGIVTLADLTKLDMRELNYLQSLVRSKRSDDLINGLKTKIGQGIKSKLGLTSHHPAHYPSAHDRYASDHSYSKVTFDFWTLKKSILNTLLQAAKAVKGGLIALKGQLIKGGGSLISAKGQFIKSKGEALSSIGKNIVSSAALAGPTGIAHYSGPAVDYGAPSSHGYDSYGAHSAPGPDYYAPTGYYGKPSGGYSSHKHHPYEAEHKLPYGGHAGILILKKVPPSQGHEIHHHHEIHHEKPVIPSPKPTSTGIKGLIGKFLAATAKASASASAQASSFAVHKTANILSHIGKAAAAGSAASAAHLSMSKEPEPTHEVYHHPTSHESYDYDTSGSYNEPYAKFEEYPDTDNSDDNEPEGTENRNINHDVYPTKAEHLISTVAALKAVRQSAEKQTGDFKFDSYGNPIHEQENDKIQISDSGISHQMNMDSLNVNSGMNENLAHYHANPVDMTIPSMQLTMSPSNTASTHNTRPHLYFGINLPLDNPDISDTKYNPFSSTGLLNYGNDQLKSFDNNNPTMTTTHIDLHPNNPELQKLLGPNNLVEPPKTNIGVGFLPTPATNYDQSDYTQTDNHYLASLRGTKRKRSPSSSTRLVRRRKSPRHLLKVVGYELGPYGPVKL